ncbi:MAG TPA: twin-arginine translocation signal domain-containing protein [Chitinivibrionales bacterium]|nr:twin-arginine translocation signal domain-containing protein [Chitinivibrionales bacterium]
MSKKTLESRRNFLKASAASAVGLAMIGPGAKKAAAAPINTTLVNLSTTPINQDIDNLRVAWITDQAVMNANHHWPQWDGFNNPSPAANTTDAVVNYSVVATDMDKLACALANTHDITTAWNTIFKIPSSKTWATAKAAIKVNTFSGLFPSVAVVAKVCNVLIGKGMLPANICIYDGGNAGPFNKSTYVGAGKPIPTGVVFGGGTGGVTVQFPAGLPNFTGNLNNASGTSSINGVDILVNCAVNKGHDRYWEYSGVTMCQKNNKQTIDFGHTGGDPSNSDSPAADLGIWALMYVNSCDYVVGNIPTSYPAKAQLCIVDCMWAGDPGQWSGSVSDGADQRSIVMGTFAGAVDHAATIKIRDQKYHSGSAYPAWNTAIVDKFVTIYGYTAADITTLMTAQTGAGKGLVDASTWPISTEVRENPHLSRQGIVQVSVSGSGIRSITTSINLSEGETVQHAEVFNVMGRSVCKLAVNPGSNHIVWDGRTNSGSLVQAGNYIVRIKGQKTVTSGELVLSR